MLSGVYAILMRWGFLVFHAFCAAFTFCCALSWVNGGRGDLGSSFWGVEEAIFDGGMEGWMVVRE